MLETRKTGGPGYISFYFNGVNNVLAFNIHYVPTDARASPIFHWLSYWTYFPTTWAVCFFKAVEKVTETHPAIFLPSNVWPYPFLMDYNKDWSFNNIFFLAGVAGIHSLFPTMVFRALANFWFEYPFFLILWSELYHHIYFVFLSIFIRIEWISPPTIYRIMVLYNLQYTTHRSLLPCYTSVCLVFIQFDFVWMW